MGKKPNMNRARNMNVDAWRERQISRRVQERIEADSRSFALEQENATEEELIEHVRRRAEELHRMPHPLEVTGGFYLRRQLGDWDALALRIGFEPLGKRDGAKAYERIYAEEAKNFSKERHALKLEKRRRKEDSKDRSKGADAHGDRKGRS